MGMFSISRYIQSLEAAQEKKSEKNLTDKTQAHQSPPQLSHGTLNVVPDNAVSKFGFVSCFAREIVDTLPSVHQLKVLEVAS